ncbi:hypothetical protein B0H10DRAFT_1960669 [Mycena sp. CBHHK59/15]|nr:hypothetical protein B0H10DRAFT_1960669 [Mycena sp. CBHHK59/15]
MIAHGNRDAPWDRRADIWALGCTIYQFAGGGLLFGHIGTHILDDTAALCGGAPADWTAYFASVPDKAWPRAYTPEAADALWATRAEYLRRGGQTAEDARGSDGASARIGAIAGSIRGRQGPDDEAQ